MEHSQVPKLVDTPFTAYEFTAEEELLAHSFTDLQVQGLRTQLSIIAMQKLGLVPDVQATMAFQLEHRYLQGKMDVLESLIQLTEFHKAQMEARLEEELGKQQMFNREKDRR